MINSFWRIWKKGINIMFGMMAFYFLVAAFFAPIYLFFNKIAGYSKIIITIFWVILIIPVLSYFLAKYLRITGVGTTLPIQCPHCRKKIGEEDIQF